MPEAVYLLCALTSVAPWLAERAEVEPTPAGLRAVYPRPPAQASEAVRARLKSSRSATARLSGAVESIIRLFCGNLRQMQKENSGVQLRNTNT